MLREGFVFGRVFLDGIGDLVDVVVPEHPAVVAGLLQNGFRQHVAAFELFHEALAFLVQHNRAVKAAVGNQFNDARDRVADRVGLDVAHVHELGAGALGHIKRFTGRAGGVCGLKAFINLGVVLLDHCLVGTKAAGSQHHAALGVKGVGCAVRGGLYAHHAPGLILDEFFGFHVGDHRDPELIGLGLEFRNEFRARVAHRNQRTLAAVAAEEKEVVVFKTHAQVVAAPFGGVKGVGSHDVNDLHVALFVTALKGVGGVPLGAVVQDPEFGLHPVARGIHFGARNEGVAAHGRHLFQKHNVGTGVLCFNGGGEPGAARTDHDDVVVTDGGDVFDDLLNGLGVGFGERHAGFFGGVFDGIKKALRGEGGAGDCIKVGAV